MDRVQVDLLAGQSNYAILRLPERQFPGVLFQGDSLHILHHDARAALRAMDEDPSAAREQLASIESQLSRLVQYYSTTLQRHGMTLPFATSGE